MLRKTKVELDLLTDTDIYILNGKNGITQRSNRNVKANTAISIWKKNMIQKQSVVRLFWCK